jgi:hypothetical protein
VLKSSIALEKDFLGIYCAAGVQKRIRRRARQSAAQRMAVPASGSPTLSGERILSSPVNIMRDALSTASSG